MSFAIIRTTRLEASIPDEAGDAASNARELKVWLIKIGLFLSSIVAASLFFGFEIALVITYGVFVHEAGHVKAALWAGLRTKGIYFLPFIGAVAVSENPKTRGQEVLVQFMGPFFGLLSALPLASGASISGDIEWWNYAFIVAGLNLFNMLPVGGLDGGQILLAVAHSIGRRTTFVIFAAGLAVGGGVSWWAQSYLVAAVFALAAGSCAWSLRRAPKTVPEPLSRRGIALTVAAYLGLFALLALMVGFALGQRA